MVWDMIDLPIFDREVMLGSCRCLRLLQAAMVGKEFERSEIMI